MLTTLDHLEHHVKSHKKTNFLSSFGKEIKIFVTIFIVVFVINSVTINAQLYREAVVDLVHEFSGSTSSKIITIQDGTNTTSITVDQDFVNKKAMIETISQQTESLDLVKGGDFASQDIVQSNLKQSLDSYSLEFNTLSPSDRVIVPDLGINVPLLQSSFTKHITEITKEDMDKDLYHGVVQYPTTPHAGNGWNMLVFGHTSYESWKHNPYATVFSKLPKLEEGQLMKVIQNGKLYEYKVITKTIVKPSKVNEEYMKYTKGNYLTLLGCYPIGSDANRIMVIGELVEKK